MTRFAEHPLFDARKRTTPEAQAGPLGSSVPAPLNHHANHRAGTIGGLLILWPGHVTITTDLSIESYRAKVERVEETICPGFMDQRCQSATLRLQSGPDRGDAGPTVGAMVGLDPDIDPGDEIRVTEAPESPETAEPVMGTGYNFYDFERGKPMALLPCCS